MMKIETPVLFDANILINFKGQLKFLFGFFTEVLIHKQVYEEAVGQALKDEIHSLKNSISIKFVDDRFPTDDIGRTLVKECDKELRMSFNIDKCEDLGEYKTLLYAKFNNVSILTSQDTTVWSFITRSKYFMGLKCITIQDFSYIIYLSASNKKERKLAKTLYSKFAREEHPFECFKSFMERNKNEIPQYIEYENNRIQNYEQLLQEYAEYYSDDCIDMMQVSYEIENAAKLHPNTCISCIYSRMDKNRCDYLIRKCKYEYSFNDNDCINIRDVFDRRIRSRGR
ncbi:hypothetical protein EHE19_001045 [Ruminiclostridium herbifermentans]|uniref:PIN domain-containing protein n=1 Tax=Ruminiclostridium herbifermentans TaxID=2488810 RepID=A0A4U7JGR0_9FIRM|nr:hypothetical protein [Ruminiclostridium herbifermentans]QNU67173.1 hypothetical protein EHE19_001045 [Ruminiclostridium herbifermentans]